MSSDIHKRIAETAKRELKDQQSFIAQKMKTKAASIAKYGASPDEIERFIVSLQEANRQLKSYARRWKEAYAECEKRGIKV